QVQACSALFLPQTVLGELYCGAHLSQNPGRHIEKIQTFLAAVALLSPGLATAEHYGRIRAQLAKAGTPIPENDIWIAALALEHQLPLAARDAHFDLVIRLPVLKW
ncbi:MAG TPA: PIN domain-containing protein, partial [Dongiaceae bacterium]|nr:PIN domain-containing protein [Dongiaceae bacterium]